jgi:hypothetical protein
LDFSPGLAMLEVVLSLNYFFMVRADVRSPGHAQADEIPSTIFHTKKHIEKSQ